MNSLRSRIILGSALVALVPLAVAMVLLSRHIENMVRDQAISRLDGTLGGLTLQLSGDGARAGVQIRSLAADPQLKRLYLVRPGGSRELTEYLDERRVLLGLDFLQVADTSGRIIADAALATSAIARGEVAARPVGPTRGPGAVALVPLDADSGLALAATAAIQYERESVGIVHGGVVLGPLFLARLRQTSGVDLTLRDGAGRTTASTAADDIGPTIMRTVPLQIGAPPFASLTGLVSTAAADQTIVALRWTALVLALLGIVLAVLLGTVWSSQISRPVERLAALSQRIAGGDWEKPIAEPSLRELETLVAALDRMRLDLLAYRERLVVSERQAAWGQMARAVAHEIRNPLTPIAVAMSDLRRSHELQRADFPQILDQAVRTVGAEVESLKRLVQEFSEFGRMPAPQPRLYPLSELFAELETLHGTQHDAGRLVFVPRNREITLNVDPGQLRQAMINLIRNALEAVDGGGQVTVSARVIGSGNGVMCEIAVADNGPGLTTEQRAQLFVPGFTTKPQGNGLGLAIVQRIVSDHHGTIAADDTKGAGTTFRIRLPL